MKLSDEELVQLIWVEQLNTVARGAVQRYVNSEYNVKENNTQNFKFASALCFGARWYVTKKLSKGQLGRRLKKLFTEGKTTGYDDSHLSYYLSGPQALDAYEYSRQYWLSLGFPNYAWDDDNSCIITQAMDMGVFEANLTLLRFELLEKFGTYTPPVGASDVRYT